MPQGDGVIEGQTMGDIGIRAGQVRGIAFAVMAVAGLAACDENGQFGGAISDGADAAAAAVPANAPNQTVSVEQDVERPDLFETRDRGLWDGRPSLGGVWVAHPDVQDPERVLIRNTENGTTIVGALFRRERNNPGPILQVSSDAAEALGMLAGAPTNLYVVALRREEVSQPAPEENPVVADLEAPVNVAATPLDDDTPPVVEAAASTAEATASVASAAAALSQTAAAAVPDPAPVVQVVEDTPETVDVSSIISAPVTNPSGAMAQIGIFSVEANANAAAQQINAAGIPAEVVAETMGGQQVWRVTAGPLPDDSAIASLRGLGYVDAFVIEDQ